MRLSCIPLRAVAAVTSFVLMVGGGVPFAPAPFHLSMAGAQDAAVEAPFGNKLSGAVVNYNRVRATIGTAGLLRAGAVAELKAARFATIVDLRTPEEGTATEKQEVETAGMRYVNIPIANGAPTDAQLADFDRLVSAAAAQPMLVHCASANRAGALWTHYLVRVKKVSYALAAAEGRAIGMQPAREEAVRAQLGDAARN